MAPKRKFSSTLMNLKFMQRESAAHKVEEEAKEEIEVVLEAAAEVVTAASGGVGAGAGASTQVAKKCIVIMEGNPQPGAVKGRMSFQSFNPSIDKLNEEARGDHQTESASPSNYREDSSNSSRTDEVLGSRFKDPNIDSSESISLNELKRKQPELDMETPRPHGLLKAKGQNVDGGASSQSNGRGFHNSNKRDKLEFNHLRPKK